MPAAPRAALLAQAPALLRRAALLGALLGGAWLGSGCTTAIVAKHVYEKLTEGDPTPCRKLNSVQRALESRCGAFEPGTLLAADIAEPQMQECPLTVAARQPSRWPALPELLAKGATPATCRVAPWVALAQVQPCPDWRATGPAERDALRRLAEDDPRSLRPETVRALSCPGSRAVGLDEVLAHWQAEGRLAPGALDFSPLGALHPSALASPLGAALEADGHPWREALAAGGFDDALRQADLGAIDWWLQREPGLVDLVPATRSDQVAWVPLARVLMPGFLPDESRQRAVVDHLLARGADPWRRLPHDPAQSPATLAQRLHSPLAARLQSAPLVPPALATPSTASPGPIAVLHR